MKLLAYRNFSGIGDWMMAMSVLKMVNIQFPTIDIYLNMKGRTVAIRKEDPKDLPEIIDQMINSFDVRIAGKLYDIDPLKHASNYDYVSGNMAYRKREERFFTESMFDRFKTSTGLDLVFQRDMVAKYSGASGKLPDISKPYILIQSCSKRRHVNTKWKDYGADNMKTVAGELKKDFNVVQIGEKRDILINGLKKFLSVSLSTLHALMVNCLAFVGLDGMLGVFASYHNVRHFIIYSGKFNFKWTDFFHREQINGNDLNPSQVAGFVRYRLMQTISRKTLECSYGK